MRVRIYQTRRIRKIRAHESRYGTESTVQSVGLYYQFTRNEMLSDSHDAEMKHIQSRVYTYVREG